MDKRIIHAVAGSGKTTYIINQLNLEERFIIITYTNNNYNNLINDINDKFNFLPENIKVFTLFTFLYQVGLKPIESLIPGFDYINTSKGIDYHSRAENTRRWTADNPNYYINSKREYYSFRMSRLINSYLFSNFKEYIENHFCHILIDEVQDFSAHDFDLLLNLASLDVKVTAVGDFYQHTYDSSQDGNKNGNLYDDYTKYKARFDSKYEYDETTLTKSYRCSKNVVAYVKNNLNIIIESHKNDNSLIKYVENEEEIDSIINNDNVVKLFFQQHYNYDINKTDNWGNSKGSTYENVCVVLNPTTFSFFKNDNLESINEKTKNKLYVAITRTKGDLYFIEERKLSKYKRR